MKHRDYTIIRKIVNEIDIAFELLGNESLSEFEADEKTKRAVCMTVVNIGELVKNITQDTRGKYNYLPWKGAAGFRDIATGAFEEIMLIKSQEDLAAFKAMYDITEEIEKIY